MLSGWAFEVVDTIAVGLPLGTPFGVGVDAGGNVFFSDASSGLIKEIVAESQYHELDKLGVSITSPGGVAVDESGNLYVSDASNVYKVAAAGGYSALTTLASGFNHPLRVAVDGSGNVFVADTGNNAVKEILPSGTVNTLGGSYSSPSGHRRRRQRQRLRRRYRQRRDRRADRRRRLCLDHAGRQRLQPPGPMSRSTMPATSSSPTRAIMQSRRSWRHRRCCSPPCCPARVRSSCPIPQPSSPA
ncbi:MAG: hypothetical protein WDN69_32245 [Aliidongia sp.]